MDLENEKMTEAQIVQRARGFGFTIASPMHGLQLKGSFAAGKVFFGHEK